MFDFAESKAVGASGGIIMLWNKECFKSNTVTIHRNFIIVTGFLQNFECALVNVYAPNDPRGRRELWSELLQAKTLSQIPWCIGGDFNEIRLMSERVGCDRVDRNMRNFQDFIDQAALLTYCC